MTISDRIKAIREKKGISQRVFAEKIKVAQGTLAQFETGQRKTKDIHITAICREFNINENWLRTGEGDMELKTDNSVLAKLSTEYNLSETEQKVLYAYLHLNESRRQQLIDFATHFADILSKVSLPELAATLAERPADNDKNLSREQRHQLLDEEIDAEEKGQASSVSTTTSGLGESVN